jgi:5-methylcytosine-specific restriction enzyme subunit McrC
MTDQADSDAAVVVAMDCSRIPLATREDDEWLRRLVSAAKPAEMLLRLGHHRDDPDDEPVASFDGASGVWWAGRYVGEVQFEGRSLRLEPRFGMPALLRWLSTIWGVRLIESKGRYEQQRIWLWLVIAHLWAYRLIAAAKHGLPFRRIETAHHGRALRGRLLVRETALARTLGSDHLASTTRTRVVDPIIGGIILSACERLQTALGQRRGKNYWLPERGKTLVDDLQSALGGPADMIAASAHTRVRYSPITENYRPVVELSQSILTQRPRMAASGGHGKAFGILLDVAEIWELYVAKLLQIGLPALRVSHTGRATEHFRWLLSSAADGDKFGSLRPDIVIADHQGRCLAIADAKYKTNRINASNRTGVITDDLYQLSAYLSGFGDPTSRLDGFLIYPADEGGQVASRLSPKNPWTLSSAPQRNLWFLSTDCGVDADAHALTDSERSLANTIQGAITRSAA